MANLYDLMHNINTNEQELTEEQKLFNGTKKRVREFIAHAFKVYEVPVSTAFLDNATVTFMKNKYPLIQFLRKSSKWNEETLSCIDTLCIEHPSRRESPTTMWRKLLDINDVWTKARNFVSYVRNNDIAEKQNIERCDVEGLNNYLPEGTRWSVHENQKTTKIFLKIFAALGVDTEGNREFRTAFQKYADTLCNKPLERVFILSVNPERYIGQSVGANWASCHAINPDVLDKFGIDIDETGTSHYHGMYKAGTISYLLDKSTVVFWTVDKPRYASADAFDLNTIPMFTRQLFHINTSEKYGIQARLYPYDEDETRAKDYRSFVEKIMAECLGLENKWVRSGNNYARLIHYGSGSMNYHDPSHFHCDLFYHKSLKVTVNDTEEEEVSEIKNHDFGCMTIGHYTYCTCCGESREYDSDSFYYGEDDNNPESRLTCPDCTDGAERYKCEDCGRSLNSEDDVIWVGDYVYCSSCADSCERCGDYFANDDLYTYTVPGRYYSTGRICERCMERHDYAECNICGNIVPVDYWRATEEGTVVCDDCIDDNTFTCDKCDELHDADDDHELNGKHYCSNCYEEMKEELEDA